ncbi:Na+/H+ antiporter subunit D [Ruficoccus amylovorans]|uniref:Na+/H+ antiporter subunit D n=1 Tax=Ruficoccus amylovorans TaxID=1804625 RepID=A0A842HGF1_9BACT|nr:proton-conducting transporter membrane subunit [Ruficoccus amylovorans]MBC2595260.1 Na+/H+ antiporter subunit D [Ruficoccus amylovorans]
MTTFPLYLCPLIPLGAALLQVLLQGRGRAQGIVGVVATGLLMICGIALVGYVKANGTVVLDVGGWTAPVGVRLQADMLSALMVAITGVIGFCGALHSLPEAAASEVRRGYHVVYQFLLFGVCGSFLTNDLFNLYVWFEVMLLSSFVLLSMGRKKDQLEGAVKYVVLNIVASMVFLIGAGLVYATLGTLNFSDIAHRVAEGQGGAAGIRLAAVFLLLAFSVKAGLFPLYAWLPSSYHTPNHTVSAVFAGLLTKVGVYALIRTFGAAFAVEDGFVLPVLWVVSLLTMVTGVLGAASQFHIRKILSFHIISQIGYMTFGLALGTAGAIAAAIFYVIHHILVKTNLFFAASAIDRIGGGEDLKKTGGLYSKAPWLAALFLIPALSLGGIPPFSGFWAKLALLREILGVDAWVAATIALVVGIFTLFSMTKIWAEAFWKDRPEDAAPVRRIHAGHVVPMVLLAAGTVVLSVYPTYLFELAQIAAHDLLTPPAR